MSAFNHVLQYESKSIYEVCSVISILVLSYEIWITISTVYHNCCIKCINRNMSGWKIYQDIYLGVWVLEKHYRVNQMSRNRWQFNTKKVNVNCWRFWVFVSAWHRNVVDIGKSWQREQRNMKDVWRFWKVTSTWKSRYSRMKVANESLACDWR